MKTIHPRDGSWLITEEGETTLVFETQAAAIAHVETNAVTSNTVPTRTYITSVDLE